MKVDVEQVASCVRRLTIEVPADQVNREFSALYRDLQQRVQDAWFSSRQSAASDSRKLLPSVRRARSAAKAGARSAVRSADNRKRCSRLVNHRSIRFTLTKGQPLRFVATTQVIPDFTLTDYQGWQFERRIP